jgi:predicted nucleic acid-binding protein
MILLDTDILTHYFAGHPRVLQRARSAEESPATTVISRIQVLQGRFNSVLKAADGAQLERAREQLARAEAALARITIVPLDAAAEAEFDRLRQNRKLKKIGRGDLLIACIALAQRATLVTRNQRDFRQVPGLQLDNWAD